MEYISIIITAIFVNNIVFAQFLGICPFIGVSRKLSSAAGMGAAVTFVMVLATAVTWLLQDLVLNPFGLGFMQTIVFILVIAALVQMLEIILKKIAPALYSALGVFLPLITTNCAVLGVAILVVRNGLNLGESLVYAFATAIGFTMAISIFAGIREQLARTEVPAAMRGVPIALICAGLLAMAFMGFSGIKIG
ncbi:electron transport complex protein RnfA [Duncaniella freteri]|uniref:Ion-translocating oxidoreductase complex subunit A n=5 Tax=Duncaniella TaxID=2518495 RepID=A0A4Z0VCJ9_9BACT|nr:electron transport complex protein RnfA [Duncaniella freteri]MDE7026759.1 electron transport complex protein RnfA [Duncaniella freteri]NBJ07090.1 electron transport complex protein RnfA [Alistipes sp. Z76]NCE69200.1 electron transport complex protein RnfA [Muribaculaceae bacterium M3]TGG41010.1 electron transport complex protein RnfA [Duncaniella freteri]